VVLENSMGKLGLDAKTLLRKCIWIDYKLWPLIIFKILKNIIKKLTSTHQNNLTTSKNINLK
jgi:hypothetical protein